MCLDQWFAYDADGRTTDVYQTSAHSGGFYHTTAGYAVNGQLTSISGVPGKSTYTIGLDSNGRPDTSTYGVTAVATNVNYNAAGQTTEIDYGATDKDVYTYDPYTELMNRFTFTLDTTSLVGTPTWNANRTLKQLAIADGFNATNTQTCNFNPTDHTGTGYDDVGRLVGVYCANGGTVLWTQTYGYDQYDNFSKTGTTSWNPTYDAATNHMLGGATYDADGQVTYDRNNSFAWDGYHKMSAAEAGASLGSCGGAGVFCYTYDALGRMVEKNNAGTFTQYLYSPAGLTAIMSGQTANAFRAPIPGGGLFTSNSVGTIVSHMDWQGSARLAAQLNHTVARDTSYSPYGEDYGGSGTGIVQNFAGMLSDNDSNVLFDTPNREFDVSSGSRWLSPDPARASWNAYAYPTNPNSFIDPSGLVRLPTDPGDRISGSWFLGLSGFGNLGGGCTIDGVDASCAQATQTVAGGLGTIDRSNPFTQGSAVGIAQSNLSSGLLTPSTVMPGVTGTVTPCEEGDFCSNVTANEAPVGPEAGSDLMLLAQGPGQLPPSASGAVQAARQMAQNAAQNGRYGPKTTPPTPPRSIVDPRQTPDMNPQEPWWIRLWGMWDVTGTLTELPFVIMPSVQACGYSGSCPDQPAKGPI